MKGDYTFRVLEVLAEGSRRSADLVEVFLTSNYGASYGTLQYNLQKKSAERAKTDFKRASTKRFYDLIYRLKRDGLIQINKNETLDITAKGKQFWERLRKRKNANIPSNRYRSATSDRFIIVAFDIPEKERRKRNWLRSVLKNIGLTMTQKSLWLGKVKLPPELIADLHKLDMTDYVEIFEITKTGSLKHVI
jgi:CRISPR-associated endonuclease Cas2